MKTTHFVERERTKCLLRAKQQQISMIRLFYIGIIYHRHLKKCGNGWSCLGLIGQCETNTKQSIPAEKVNCQKANLSKSQLIKKSTFQKVNFSKSQLIKKSTYQKVNFSKSQLIKKSTYQKVNLSKSQFTKSISQQPLSHFMLGLTFWQSGFLVNWL